MVTACSKQRKQQRSIDDARTIGLYIMYVLLRKVDNKKKELRMGPTLKKSSLISFRNTLILLLVSRYCFLIAKYKLEVLFEGKINQLFIFLQVIEGQSCSVYRLTMHVQIIACFRCAHF